MDLKKITQSLLVLLCLSGFAQKKESNIVNIGDKAPVFNLVNIENNTTATIDYSGKITLINFFATWCGPCLREMPLLESKLWDKYKDNPNFQLLSIGRDHNTKEIISFIKKKQFSFPIYPDKGKIIYSKFATKYIPRNYLIDGTGKIIYSSIGYSNEEFKKLTKTIKKLLK